MRAVVVVALLLVAVGLAVATPVRPFNVIERRLISDAQDILSKKASNLASLTDDERNTLKRFGFSDGDLSDQGEPVAVEMPVEMVETEAKVEEDGWARTGVKFWYRAFIPGSGCPESRHLEYINLDPLCEGTDRDGDRTVLGAPFPSRDYFRHDQRCKSSAFTASRRVSVVCFLEKKGSEYRVTCQGSAGVPRHYQKPVAIFSERCFKLVCEDTDNFRPRLTTAPFRESISFRLNGHGTNPCSTMAQLTGADVVMDFTIEVAVRGETITLKLTGTKSRFPDMEGYLTNSEGTHDWFWFPIDGTTVKSLLLPGVSVRQDTRTFKCTGC